MHERFRIVKNVRINFYSLCSIFVHENNIIGSCGKSLPVESDTLDSLLATDMPSVMKMDIEGAEVLALNGATTTLKKLRKIIVEVHGDNLDEVKKLLESYNFDLQIVTNMSLVHIIGSKEKEFLYDHHDFP